jgi:hypothetical protein
LYSRADPPSWGERAGDPCCSDGSTGRGPEAIHADRSQAIKDNTRHGCAGKEVNDNPEILRRTRLKVAKESLIWSLGKSPAKQVIQRPLGTLRKPAVLLLTSVLFLGEPSSLTGRALARLLE